MKFGVMVVREVPAFISGSRQYDGMLVRRTE